MSIGPGDGVSFDIIAHDFASRQFRDVGREAMQMAARVRLANDLMDKSFWRSGGQITVWTKVILTTLPLIPPLIVAITVALGALNSMLVSTIPGVGVLGAAFVANLSAIKNSAAFDDLTAQWKAFGQATRPTVLKAFGAAVQTVITLLKVGAPIAKAFGDVFTNWLQGLNKQLHGAGFASFLEWVKNVGSANFGNLLKGLENLTVGIGLLGKAFTGQGRGLAQWFQDITGSFRAWAGELGKSDGFKTFLGYFEQTWPKVSALIGNLTVMLTHLLQAVAPLAPVFLDLLNGIVRGFNKIPVHILTDLVVGIVLAKGALYAFGIAFAAVNAIMAATPVGIAVAAIAALAAGLVIAYRRSERFREVVNTALQKVGEAWAQLQYIVAPIVDWFLTYVWPQNVQAMKLFGKAALNAAKILATAFTTAWNTMAPIFRFLLAGMASVMSGWAKMLDVLSKVPGFGWAKTAAAGMRAAAESALRLAGSIRSIPRYWESTVRTNFVEYHTVHQVNVGIRQGQEIQPRATGGRARARHPYWVGEEGPELFVPDLSGTVIPADKSQQMVSQPAVGGGVDPNVLARVVAKELAKALANVTIRLDDGDGNGRKAYLMSGGF